MPLSRIVSSALCDATARWKRGTTIRRAILVLGMMAMTVGAAALSAAPALASVGSEPGNLIFSPGDGPTTLAPTWSTTDGCPAGHQGSAQMAIFNGHGVLLSRISPVAYNVTHPFKGTLDGTIDAILRYAQVAKGGTLEFAVGCYSRVGGTGAVQWMQSDVVTLSSSGTSFTSSSPGGQQGSSSGQSGGSSSSALNLGANTGGATSAAGGGGSSALAAWLGGAAALVVAIVAVIWIRRRQDRSRLM
jgi:hypothetical protein